MLHPTHISRRRTKLLVNALLWRVGRFTLALIGIGPAVTILMREIAPTLFMPNWVIAIPYTQGSFLLLNIHQQDQDEAIGQTRGPSHPSSHEQGSFPL